MSEIGYQTQGLLTWDSMAAEANETNPALRWPLSVEVYDKMRREDSQVGSVLRAVTFPIRSTTWMIDPAGARDDVVTLVADSLGLPVKGRPVTAPLRSRDRFDFDEHLRLALLELVYGHSVFEQVYRIDEQGMTRLRKLAWRPPRTISDWDVADDGGLVAVEQYGISGKKGDVRIPVGKLVVYTSEREGANWVGQSLLRTAYKNWLLKDRMLRAQALTIERNGLGIPVYKGAPPPDGVEMTTAEIDDWNANQRDEGLKLAKALRAGENAGASIPGGSSLDLMGVTGKLPDTDGPIRYHDEQIARAVLAHFLNLGTETGSWALGSTFANFFTDSLNATSGHIAGVLQRHVVEDLVDANWGEAEPAPQIVASTIGEEQPATAEAIKALVECGALTMDQALEAYLRQRYRLPVMDARVDEAGADGASDAEQARFAAETVQKVYLGVGPVIDKSEAREIVRRAGAALGPDPKEGE